MEELDYLHHRQQASLIRAGRGLRPGDAA